MPGNIAKWLKKEEAKSGELIEAIVIGRHDDHKFERERFIPEENQVVSREVGLRILDVDYDDGYGGADCFPHVCLDQKPNLYDRRIRRRYGPFKCSAQPNPM